MDTSLKVLEGYERAGMSDYPDCAATLYNASFVHMKLNDLVRARECAERSYVILHGLQDPLAKSVEKLLKDIHELEQKNPDYRSVFSDSRLCSNCNKVC